MKLLKTSYRYVTVTKYSYLCTSHYLKVHNMHKNINYCLNISEKFKGK